uniref:Uncharacterized protein n=1 Tax=uncultured bacterium A1Q1_fos_1053 TaxID=1256539 RepID=L7VZM4_9BACT|nr:hypothetical protein [uncultured bacterium A1Q1_fos_1053]
MGDVAGARESEAEGGSGDAAGERQGAGVALDGASGGAGVVLVACDDESASIRDLASHFQQARVGGFEYRPNPCAVRVECRAQRLRDEITGKRFTKPCRHFVASAGAPLHFTRIRHEQHGTHDTIPQCFAIPVRVVTQTHNRAVVLWRIFNEWNRIVVGTERRARQRKPPRGGLARLKNCIAPTERIAGVVDFVKDYEGALTFNPHAMTDRIRSQACIGDRITVEAWRQRAIKFRGDRNTELGCGLRPLDFEVFGRGNNDDSINNPVVKQVGCDRQSERCFTGAGCCDSEKVARRGCRVLLESCSLPGAKRLAAAHLSGSSPSSPGSKLSHLSLHSGQTGNRCGSRLGTHTLPHNAMTGVPITIASVSLSLGT